MHPSPRSREPSLGLVFSLWARVPRSALERYCRSATGSWVEPGCACAVFKETSNLCADKPTDRALLNFCRDRNGRIFSPASARKATVSEWKTGFIEKDTLTGDSTENDSTHRWPVNALSCLANQQLELHEGAMLHADCRLFNDWYPAAVC